jgi:hypothetical protein
MKTAKIMNSVGELNPTSNWVFKNYKAYTLVRAIAKYSSNPVCSSQSGCLLNISENNELDKKRFVKGIKQNAGSFMSAVYDGNFSLAWNNADSSNKSALWTALGNDEIEL